MKQTKVYVDELPESCSKCEYCTLNHKDNYGRPFCLIARMPLYNGDKVKEERGQYKDSLSDFECPFQSLKTHDRELVKEVCEKIKVWCENIENWTNDCNHRVLSLYELNEFLNQIQKDIENG